jgi:serine/threonine protein kinase/Tfp pilus assembly protein PilF
MATLIGQELGGYRIISQIGKGGMATVYKAFQPSLDRFVAVKVMPPFYAQEDDTFVKRFKREAQSIAKLRHPNILLVIDFGEHDGLIYIVMEFVDAGTLTERLGKPLPFDEAAVILEQVASALDYAHVQGLVHRDVKPSNILLPKPDWPLLTDFGLAKIVGGSQLTITGTIAGTPAYMSPEQGQGESVDARSDIYSLGIVLYEMMTGCVPYQAETPMAVVVKHIIEPLPLPTMKNPDLPEAIERVILKALAKNPDDRYQRANALSQAFKDAISKPVTMPRERPTILEDATFDGEVPTVVDELIEAQEDASAKEIAASTTSVESETGGLGLEAPPVINQPPPTESIEEILAPSTGVISAPTKKPLKGLLEGRSWLKWFIPAGGAAAVLCILGLLIAFVIVPNIRDGLGAETEMPPTLTAQEHYIEGQNLYVAENLEMAIQEYQAAIDQGIEDYNVYFSLAEALNKAGRLDEALGIIERVVQLAPEDAWVHESAGSFYRDVGETYQAIEHFEIALGLNPDGTHIVDELVEAYESIGEYTKAREILGHSEKPELEEDPNALEEQGWEFLENKQFPEAEETFQKAVDLNPELVGAWEGLADVYWYQGEFDVAIDTLNTAITFNQEYAPLHVKLGWLYWDTSNLDKAEEAFNKARFLDPSLDDAWLGLTEVFWERGDLDGAIDVIEAAIKTNPDHEALYEKAGSLYWDNAEIDKAMERLEEAIKIAPDTTYAYQTLSDIWYELGEDAQAIASLERALDANSSRPDVHESLGYLFIELGQYDDAIGSFNQAIGMDLENGWTYLGLAYAYQNTARWDEAMGALENAERYSFEDPYLLESIGWQYIEMGNCERAIDLFNQVLGIDPDNEGASKGIETCSG